SWQASGRRRAEGEHQRVAEGTADGPGVALAGGGRAAERVGGRIQRAEGGLVADGAGGADPEPGRGHALPEDDRAAVDVHPGRRPGGDLADRAEPEDLAVELAADGVPQLGREVG